MQTIYYHGGRLRFSPPSRTKTPPSIISPPHRKQRPIEGFCVPKLTRLNLFYQFLEKSCTYATLLIHFFPESWNMAFKMKKYTTLKLFNLQKAKIFPSSVTGASKHHAIPPILECLGAIFRAFIHLKASWFPFFKTKEKFWPFWINAPSNNLPYLRPGKK